MAAHMEFRQPVSGCGESTSQPAGSSVFCHAQLRDHQGPAPALTMTATNSGMPVEWDNGPKQAGGQVIGDFTLPANGPTTVTASGEGVESCTITVNPE